MDNGFILHKMMAETWLWIEMFCITVLNVNISFVHFFRWMSLCIVCLNAKFHHHPVILLLVEHRASMKSFQALQSPAIPLTLFHDLPVLLISSSIVLHHILFSLPLPLYPRGFQSNVLFSTAHASSRSVWPIQFHFLLSIWISIGFCWVILHSSSFVILSIHFIFIIHLKHLFTNISTLVIWLVVFQVSQAYNTDFTFVLNIHIWYVVISPYRIQLKNVKFALILSQIFLKGWSDATTARKPVPFSDGCSVAYYNGFCVCAKYFCFKFVHFFPHFVSWYHL